MYIYTRRIEGTESSGFGLFSGLNHRSDEKQRKPSTTTQNQADKRREKSNGIVDKYCYYFFNYKQDSVDP